MFEKEIASMIEILKKELNYYKDLLELSNTKKTVIIEGKVAELDKIVKLEQKMIFDMGQLEKSREEEVSRLCRAMGLKEQEGTLSDINKMLRPEQKNEMESVQKALKKTLAELKTANDINGELIKQSLEYIDYSINLITGSGMETGSLYEDMGMKDRVKQNKKNLFDTKV